VYFENFLSGEVMEVGNSYFRLGKIVFKTPQKLGPYAYDYLSCYFYICADVKLIIVVYWTGSKNTELLHTTQCYYLLSNTTTVACTLNYSTLHVLQALVYNLRSHVWGYNDWQYITMQFTLFIQFNLSFKVICKFASMELE
jgi:hypothetical protein